jgi:RNA:NAD 2'-phosphotransferase (TPT1/KptA family)
LSSNITTAIEVARRHDSAHPAVLLVEAKKACEEKVIFYAELNEVWLAEPIPPKYFTQLTQREVESILNEEKENELKGGEGISKSK